MDHTKLGQADLDSPCQEFSICAVGFAVAFLVCLGIDFVCAYT